MPSMFLRHKLLFRAVAPARACRSSSRVSTLVLGMIQVHPEHDCSTSMPTDPLGYCPNQPTGAGPDGGGHAGGRRVGRWAAGSK